MLKTIRIKNFALIKELYVAFEREINIMTGETGAGKTIMIEAMGVVLGKRAKAEYIREGEEELEVEAVFANERGEKIKKILQENEKEEEIKITRKIARSGKNTIKINGRQIKQKELKKIGEALVDIHGQNENRGIMKEGRVYKLIETEEIREELKEYQKVYRLWKGQKKLKEQKEKLAADKETRLEILRWQEKEIREAKLKIGEDEEIEAEIRVQANAEKITEYLETASRMMNGEDEENIISRLGEVKEKIKGVLRYDETLNEAAEMIEEAMINLQEAYNQIRRYGEGLEYSPKRHQELRKRMEKIQLMKKKYGRTIEEIKEKQEEIKKEISAIENYETEIERIKQRIEKLREQVEERAEKMRRAREKSAEEISQKIEREMRPLGMKKGRFKIEVKEGELKQNGADEMEILFRANEGEELKPISLAASGGELSRLALAIKAVEAGRDDSAETLVFDEIDSGVGAMTANAVAECIVKASKNKQVICITHLAQIACMADEHLSIKKENEEGRTVTKVERVEGYERIKEIARMASGRDATPASIENAKEMIKQARKLKR